MRKLWLAVLLVMSVFLGACSKSAIRVGTVFTTRFLFQSQQHE
ncbi:hypothetical protein [Peribacillus sp. SCS-155]